MSAQPKPVVLLCTSIDEVAARELSPIVIDCRGRDLALVLRHVMHAIVEPLPLPRGKGLLDQRPASMRADYPNVSGDAPGVDELEAERLLMSDEAEP